MKNVLVTGAARGIGKSIVKLLSKEGYKVYGIYNKSSQKAHVLTERNQSLEMIQTDLSDSKQVEEAIKKLQGIQFFALINVAGIATGDTAADFHQESWNKTMQVNLQSPLQIALDLQDSIENGGSIVNVSSAYGYLWGMDMSLSYGASKAALANITKSLAVQLRKKKIRVNAVAPSIVNTDMTAQDSKEVLAEVSRRTPVGRIAEPEEIANAVSFLISKKASYINGHTLVVDGGYSAWDGNY